MVDLQTAIDEINTGKIEFDYKDDDCCTTEGEIVIFLKRLAELEKAVVVEVKHGKWELKSEIYQMGEEFDEEFYVECPLCHRVEYVTFEFEEGKMLEYAKKHYPYCHCGAKMDAK